MIKHSVEYSIRLKDFELKFAESIVNSKFNGNMSEFIRAAFQHLYSAFEIMNKDEFIEEFNVYEIYRKKADKKYNSTKSNMIHIRLTAEEDSKVEGIMKAINTSGSNVLRFSIWTFTD